MVCFTAEQTCYPLSDTCGQQLYSIEGKHCKQSFYLEMCRRGRFTFMQLAKYSAMLIQMFVILTLSSLALNHVYSLAFWPQVTSREISQPWARLGETLTKRKEKQLKSLKGHFHNDQILSQQSEPNCKTWRNSCSLVTLLCEGLLVDL